MMDGFYGGYGMMGWGGWFGMGFVWLLYIAIAAFVFGVVFWWTQSLFGKRKEGDNLKKRR